MSNVSAVKESNGNGKTEVTLYQPKQVFAEVGTKIINAFVSNYTRRETIDKLQAEVDQTNRSAVAMTTFHIDKLCDDKQFAKIISVFAGEPQPGETELALNAIKLGLGLGTIVTRANGHKAFEYNQKAREAFGTGSEVKDSPEAKKAASISKNFGQMLKEAARARLGSVVLKSKLELDDTGNLKLIGGAAVKSHFGAESVTIRGTGAKPVVEGKKKPVISVLAELGSGKSRSATTASKTPNQVAGQTGAQPVTADINEMVGAICNSMIETLNRVKGMGELNPTTIAILQKARDALVAVVPFQIIKPADKNVTVNSKK